LEEGGLLVLLSLWQVLRCGRKACDGRRREAYRYGEKPVKLEEAAKAYLASLLVAGFAAEHCSKLL
jgi:hypothetical protein